MKVVELSDPEWAPFWVNYKFLKIKLNEIESGAKLKGSTAVVDGAGDADETASKAEILMKNEREAGIFRLVHAELKKTSDFFARTESLYTRIQNLVTAMVLLRGNQLNGVGDSDPVVPVSPNAWGRLLQACSVSIRMCCYWRTFAIMNYCGFSKILKKHDKVTGFKTREAFMRNVMRQQNFTHYPRLLELLKTVKRIFSTL